MIEKYRQFVLEWLDMHEIERVELKENPELSEWGIGAWKGMFGIYTLYIYTNNPTRGITTLSFRRTADDDSNYLYNFLLCDFQVDS